MKYLIKSKIKDIYGKEHTEKNNQSKKRKKNINIHICEKINTIYMCILIIDKNNLEKLLLTMLY